MRYTQVSWSLRRCDIKVFYHHDNDGKCAAYIVAKYTRDFDPDNYIEIDYDQPIPFDRVSKGETIYIVDFSFMPEDMLKLIDILNTDYEDIYIKTERVFWIDHHVSAIKRYSKENLEKLGVETLIIPGIRNEGEESGAALTWKFLFPDEKMPLFVKLVSDWDIWKFEYGDKTRHFHAATQLVDSSPFGIWKALDLAPDTIEPLLNTGDMLFRYKAKMCKEQIERSSYEVEFHGFKCLVLNTAMIGSELFDSVKSQYDICIMTAFDGTKWKVSMRSDKFDTHTIAMEYGGGGHPGASGFSVKELPHELLGITTKP